MNKKLETITNLFEGKEIRSVWDSEREDYYFSVVDIIGALTDLGEIATRELVKRYRPQGLKQNKEMAKRGGQIVKNTRCDLEEELGESVISNKNLLKYQYVGEDIKQIK